MKYLLVILLLPVQIFAQPFSQTEIKRMKQQAQRVKIIRDNWGIPHVYGKTDADAVFGLLYAQCEDDFKRVEANYIEKLGRKAEVGGESELYNDLYLRLVIDSAEAVADYNKAPQWLKQLLQAYADGINYYLYTHPTVKPALLNRFKPWYQLLWTDGSIGAISTGDITAEDVKNLYGNGNGIIAYRPKEFVENSSGSNGFAIAPSKTESGKSILYINPHVTFYFRPEVHISSEQASPDDPFGRGLNAYGAVTWGQFFVYQGFNEYCGWMHTSANVDVADMYTEKIIGNGNNMTYLYEKTQRPVKQKQISIKVKQGNELITKTFTTYSTHHGPVMAKRNGQYISVRSSNRMMNGLIQSLKRRGMLARTLVVWTTEFGRTPFNQKADHPGREHHNLCFSSWMAGGGVKGGIVHGKSDEYGILPVEGKVYTHDFHATILHLLGLDHEKLTFRHAGRDYRLTDVAGEVIKAIVA